MAACPACSVALERSAKFCPECGARQAGEQAATERVVRKTVTVLFSDLVGSTALGERHDAERVRALMERYFAAMATVIERHGGTIEKFIGDAIMAIFGIPVLHEDDALRAVRAAVEMRAGLADLNAELGAEGAPPFEIRTGVNSGEVVVGSGDGARTLATGDAVNTAARLEQAAAPGEILLGELTWQLVRHVAEAVPTGGIAAKGKAQPVMAHRLVRVTSEPRPRPGRATAALVGRDAELDALRVRWRRSIDGRAPNIAMVLGSAGVGKSRLVSEFLATIDEATVLHGTCLPYGEGITYWPLAEVLRSAAGVSETDSASTASAKLHALLAEEHDGAALASRLAEAIGVASGGSPQAEIFWAVRRTFEAVARRRPLVVVWDDLQWAEPTFVELVEHLVDRLRDVPILLLLMARPELLDARPEWAAGTGGLTIVLEPLDADASQTLITAVPGGAALPADLRRRIATAAEGNPLFIEEMLAMLVDEGRLFQADDGWRASADLADVGVPPTINALLAARIDRLVRAERSVAQRASVVGRSFETAAVSELSPGSERSDVASRLLALVRKQLLEPDVDAGPGGSEAYRFRHLLIRDAAYAALPKAERAALHLAFADWVERVVAERIGEYAEITAHHLEQAYRYRLELGVPASAIDPLGQRAALHFATSARHALGRGDVAGATALRRRALVLPMPPADRVDLFVEQARSQIDLGDIGDATRLLDEATAAAASLGSKALDMRILIGRGFLATSQAHRPPMEQVVADARRAAATLESLGDPSGVARAMDLCAHASFFGGDYEAAGVAWRSAGAWAARGGDRAEEARILPLLPGTAMYGWATKSEAIAYCRQLADAHPDSPMLRARALAIMGQQHAERGEMDVALELREESRLAMNELGLPWLRIELQWDYADIDKCRGEWAAAEREAMIAHEVAEAAGWRQASTALILVETSYEQERYAEAGRWFEAAEAAAGADEPSVHASLDAWRGLLRATGPDRTAAREALRQPVDESLDPEMRASLLELRGRAFATLGERATAVEEFTAAAAIYERKEMYQYLARVTEWMARLSEDAEGAV